MCDIHHHAPCQSTCTKHMHAEIHTITHHVGAVANKVFHFPRRRRLLDSVYWYRVYSASKYRTIEPSTTMTSCGISDDVQLSTFNERAKHVIWAFYQISVKHAPVIRCPHVNSPHLPGHSVNRISRALGLNHCKVTLSGQNCTFSSDSNLYSTGFICSLKWIHACVYNTVYMYYSLHTYVCTHFIVYVHAYSVQQCAS